MISIIVTAYCRHWVATGNDKLVVSTNVVRRFRASDTELRKVQSAIQQNVELSVFVDFQQL